ncbi:DivIVA domain-containing protein [Geodermatophilus bullaregiensis]|uniref:DivIVA domain-containing protein n=1 Tax=Geodermatophilus bullaregiensis TaxID=1564160 RepID=UPI00195908A3|nr:DivIVA domain-containing protein [Geodermatophilus bullaregiensis]MBM7808912.1 DivIVA domain-containing protein [Geodermatophilus bullaregiensis]
MSTSTDTAAWSGGRRLTPADVRDVRFGRSSIFHPGYDDTEVDRFLDRVGQELDRLHAEKAELRDRVHALQARVDGEARPEAPSAQAVGILAAAQQTADQYVAEAEALSRVMTTEAREHYEEQVRQAREKVGAMIQAAQEAAARITGQGRGGLVAGEGAADPQTADLQEQVVYLQAFSQACRTQLRSYLEALLDDVEREWGAAHPDAVPAAPARLRGRPPQPVLPAAAPARREEPATVEAAAVLLSEDALRPDARPAPAEGAARPTR